MWFFMLFYIFEIKSHAQHLTFWKFKCVLFRLEAREAGLVESKAGDKQMKRNMRIRTTIKTMFENGEMSLAKLMRRMGALWTKTQAAKKSNVPQAGGEPPAGPQQAGDEQALRNVLQSVTDDADVDAPEARL